MFKKFFALITILLISVSFFSTNVFADTTYQTNKKLLVVLVEFTEEPGTLDSYPNNKNSDGTYKYDGIIKNNDAYYSHLFFGDYGGTVRQYYRQVSDGKLDYMPAEETAGVSNDGIVRIRLPFAHPNEYLDNVTAGCLSYRAQDMIVEGLLTNDLFDSSVNFSTFDTNSDNAIPLDKIYNTADDELNIVFVLASGEVLPKTRAFCSMPYNAQLDNTTITGMFTFLNDTSSLGTICHEIAHLRGASDLYNMKGTNIIDETIMFNSNVSSYLDPYHKIKLGFVSPTIVESSGTYTVNSADPNNPGQYNVLKIPIRADYGKQEYFLVENRQFNGFDEALKLGRLYGGIAVWHIEENLNNSGMSRIRLEIAKKMEILPNGDGIEESFYYAGGTGSDTFGSSTLPCNSKNFSDKDGMVTITVNSPSSSSMSITVNKLNTPPQNFKASSEGLNTKLTWDPVDGASEYELKVDNNEFISVGSGTSYLLPYNQPDGQQEEESYTNKHSYIIRAKDVYGSTIESREIDTMGIRYGDVDRNGLVDNRDGAMLNDYLLGIKSFLTDTQMLAADVDGSGALDAYDSYLISSYTAGITNQFSVGQLKVITYGDVNGDGFVNLDDYAIVNANPDGPNGERRITDLVQRIAAQVSTSNPDGSSDISITFDAGCIKDYIDGKLMRFWVMTDPHSK